MQILHYVRQLSLKNPYQFPLSDRGDTIPVKVQEVRRGRFAAGVCCL